MNTFRPYEVTFGAGVNLAIGDVNGDGFMDVVAAASSGSSRVRVIDGRTGGVLRDFSAFAPGFAGGANVAIGDLNGDGAEEIVVGAGPGGPPLVTVFDGATGSNTARFFAYAPVFAGGVSVAVADADIITAPGAGGGPVVLRFDGRSFALLSGFLAYPPTFLDGVRVATGDLDGDGRAEIIAAAGSVIVIVHSDGEETARRLVASPLDRSGARVAVAAGVVFTLTDSDRRSLNRFNLVGTGLGSIAIFDQQFVGGVSVGS